MPKHEISFIQIFTRKITTYKEFTYTSKFEILKSIIGNPGRTLSSILMAIKRYISDMDK
jgi:hypothetical protein